MPVTLEELKNMDYKRLEALAAGIRGSLISNVSKTGGHLASNLGVVELTIAIHKAFDSPKDKIIWDVGHQSYVHKILTGREEDMEGLRMLDGISGFPKRRESIHDHYDTGHSSTSIGAAFGMAVARDLKKEKHHIVAVIGDGSLTGGPAFEALNSLGQSGTKVIIILNDNGMSISKNTGGLSEHLGKLRTSKGYLSIKKRVKGFTERIPVVGDRVTETLSGTKDRIKYALLSGGVVFEELGLTYLGPVDGHNIKDIVAVLEQAKNARGPVLVHAITEKGKGYKPAEENPNLFHGLGPFDVETGKPLSCGEKSYSDIFGEKLVEIAENNNNVIAITAAMTDGTGLCPFKERFPKRLFDTGIAEAHSVIFAAGTSLGGLKPFVAIYSSFLQRAYDEIMEDVCLQNLPVVFAIDRAGIVGQDGETHHGIFDLSYLLPMPNMTILAPADGNQLRDMMDYATEINGPVAIRYPRGCPGEETLCSKFRGWNIRVREQGEIDILAVGTMLDKALKAADILKSKGINAGVINVGVVKPFDDSQMNNGARLLVTLEDNVERGGFGEMITCLYPDKPVLRIAWPEKFIEHGKTDELYMRYGMDTESIADRIICKLNES